MPVTRRSMAGSEAILDFEDSTVVIDRKAAVGVKRKALGEINGNRGSTVVVEGPIKPKVAEKRSIAACRPTSTTAPAGPKAAPPKAASAASKAAEAKTASDPTTETEKTFVAVAEQKRLKLHQPSTNVAQPKKQSAAAATKSKQNAKQTVAKTLPARVDAPAAKTSSELTAAPSDSNLSAQMSTAKEASQIEVSQKASTQTEKAVAKTGAALPGAKSAVSQQQQNRAIVEKENIAPGTILPDEPKTHAPISKPAAATAAAPLGETTAKQNEKPAAKVVPAKTANVARVAKANVPKATNKENLPKVTNKENVQPAAAVSVAPTIAPAAKIARKQSLTKVVPVDDASMFITPKPGKSARFAPTIKAIDWDDLDAEDGHDPVMVAEYVEDCIAYLREVELETLPIRGYMAAQNNLDMNMRCILIDWLVEVHAKFRMLPETLFLCVNIIDRFLSVKQVVVSKLQLVGIAALVIAAKYEEIFCPAIDQFSFMADHTYTKEEILNAERCVLRVLKFDLRYPNPLNFLRRGSKADGYDLQNRTMAKYFLESMMMDEHFIGTPQSLASAASLYLARIILQEEPWSKTMDHFAGYTIPQMKPVVNQLLALMLKVAESEEGSSVYRKYCSPKVFSVAQSVDEFVTGRSDMEDFGLLWK